MAKTKTEKLLLHMKKTGGMTRKQMVEFLLKLEGYKYESYDDSTYNSTLYGTTDRKGILERFCKADRSGPTPVYKVTKKIRAPFTTAR